MDKMREFKELQLEKKIAWLYDNVRDDRHDDLIILFKRDLKDYQTQESKGGSQADNAKENKRSLEGRVDLFITTNWQDLIPLFRKENKVNELEALDNKISAKKDDLIKLEKKLEEKSIQLKSLELKMQDLSKELSELAIRVKKEKKHIKINVISVSIFLSLISIAFLAGWFMGGGMRTQEVAEKNSSSDSLITLKQYIHNLDSISGVHNQKSQTLRKHIIDSMKTLLGDVDHEGARISKPVITVFITKTPGSGSDPDKEKLLKQDIEIELQKKFNPYMQPYENSPDLKITYGITKVTPQELKYVIRMKDKSLDSTDLAPFDMAKKELISSLNAIEMKKK